MHDVTGQDRRLAKIVRDLPGSAGLRVVPVHRRFRQTAFSRFGRCERLPAQDHRRDQSSAKDFRTWAGTVQAALALAEAGPCENETQGKRNIVEAIRRTATRLGNKPATCRNYYVHPAVHMAGVLTEVVKPPDEQTRSQTVPGGLHPEEEMVMALIRRILSAGTGVSTNKAA